MVQRNYEQFVKELSDEHSKKVKGLFSVYLKIHFYSLIVSLLQQGYTEKMVFITLIKIEPSLRNHLKFNTLRSWIRKNIRKGKLKAGTNINENSILDFKEINREESLPVNEKNSYLLVNNLKETSSGSESRLTTHINMKIPTPQEPLHHANREALIELTGFDLDEFYVDSNGFLFDGFSSDKTTNLAPVPNQFQILAQQDGIKKHYFLYKDQTIDSKTILQFIKEKIRTGTLSLTFRKL